MNPTVFFRPEAELDLREAYRWYQDQVKGMGDNLLLHVDATLSNITRHPKSYPEIHRNVRRALIRRFPYGIFYILKEEKIVVIAFFHVKRDPKSWKERL